MEWTEDTLIPTLVEVLDSCPMDIFSNINALLRVMVTLPMTTCTVERLFSAAHRIKTRLRSSMSTRRHNSLSLLSMEHELADSLDNEEIIALFNSNPGVSDLFCNFMPASPTQEQRRVVMPAVANQIFILMCIWIVDFGLEVRRSGTVAVQGTILYDLTA